MLKTVVEKKYTAQLIQNLKDFEAVEPSWSQLLKEANETHVYWTHGFLVSWLKYFQPQSLLIILFYDETEKLCGAIPLCIQKSPLGLFQRKLRRVQFVGCDPCVYDIAPPIALPAINRLDLLNQALDVLFENKLKWDVLDFKFFDDEILCQAIQQKINCIKNYEIKISETDAMPVLYFDEAHAGKNQKTQKSVRQDLRRLRKHLDRDYSGQVLKMSFLGSLTETEHFMEQFSADHITHWQERGVQSDFKRYPLLKDFYVDLFKQKKVVCSVYTLGETPISWHLLAQHLDSMGLCIVMMEPNYKAYRPGILHLETFIDYMREVGAQKIEFGRGDQAYKHQWTHDKIRLWNLLVFGNKWSSFLYKLDQMLIKFLRKNPE